MKNTKTFTIFAGVNGAGKSTLFGIEGEKDLGVRLNSDEILHSLKLDWRDTNAQILAGKELLKRQKECLEKGLSFNQETTLSGAIILSTIRKAKELGYIIHLRYVGVENVDIAKERIEKRVARGGHGVTGEMVERRFEKSKENFLKIYDLCDTVTIYDNTITMQMVVSVVKGDIERTTPPVLWVEELLSRLKN